MEQVQWLRAGWLIDGRGGPALRDRLIGLQGGRVAAIQAAGAPWPDSFLDFSAAAVLPALIDAHVHLAFATDGSGPDEGAALIERHLRRLWRCGVLNVRDAGDSSGAVLGYKLRNADDAPGVKIAAAGWGWHAAGRYGRTIARACPMGQRLAEAVLTQRGADHVKIIHSGINSLNEFGRATPAQFERGALQAAVKAAHAAGLAVMVHANGEEPVESALAAGCDSIEHGYFMGRANLARMADRQTFWVPTVVPMAALAERAVLSPAQRDAARRMVAHQLEQIALARRLGVPIAAGTDAGSPGVAHGAALWRELELLCAAGLSPEAAVACATSNAGRLLGQKQRGVLLPGWRGDLIVVAIGGSGSPLRLPESGAVIAIHSGGRWWPEGQSLL